MMSDSEASSSGIAMADSGRPDSPNAAILSGISSLGGLSPFTVAMAARFVEKESSAMPHLIPFLLAREKSIPAAVADGWQRGCPELLPGLRKQPFWRIPCSNSCNSWIGEPPPLLVAAVQSLSAAYESIKKELLALRGHEVFQPYRAPTWAGGKEAAGSIIGKAGTDSGTWNVAYLELHGAVDCKEIQALCPATMAALARIPRRYGHSLFSSLAPGSHIPTHCGPTNRKLRLHLPLVVPRGVDEPDAPAEGPCSCTSRSSEAASSSVPRCERACWLRVGPITAGWKEGQVLVFDDSFQHEAANYAASARLVLIVDIWHPDLTDSEVRLLELIRKAQLRAAKAMGASDGVRADDDFFQVLRAAQSAGADDAVVFPADSRSDDAVGGCGAGIAEGAAAPGTSSETAELHPLPFARVVDD